MPPESKMCNELELEKSTMASRLQLGLGQLQPVEESVMIIFIAHMSIKVPLLGPEYTSSFVDHKQK